MQLDSERIAKRFYEKLGPQRMVARFSEEHTRSCVNLVRSFASQSHRILDIGCGIGRIANPLSKSGMYVTGVDFSAEMIAIAKLNASRIDCPARYEIGSMLNLPFESASFDRVYCFRAFTHLLTRDDQLQALREMHRVLEIGGRALIEVNDGESKGHRKHIREEGFGPDGRVATFPVEGLTNIGYTHNKRTLQRLAKAILATRYETKFANIAHRRRIILWFWK